MVLHVQYGGIREKICAPQAISIPGEGNLSAATYFLWLQARNRAGYNLPSDSTEIAVAAGDRLDITLPADCRRDGEDIHRWIVLAGLSNEYATNWVIFAVEGRDEFDVTPLPVTISLIEDSQLAGRVEVSEDSSSENQLPQSDRLNGMRRFLRSSGDILEFTSKDNKWVPVYPQKWNAPVSNTRTDLNGCNRSLSRIKDEQRLIISRYEGTGSIGEPVVFWLVNDGPNPIEKGVQIALSISIGEHSLSPYSREVGLLELSFVGIANKETGILDTTDDSGNNPAFGVGAWIADGGEPTGLALPKDLLPGFACVLAVRPHFNAFEQGGFFEGAIIRISPSFYKKRAQYSPVAALQPNYIAQKEELCRIVPWDAPLSCLSLSGWGNVHGWIFQNSLQQLFGLTPNQVNQKLAIATNGIVSRRATVQPVEDLRAIVGTVDGIGALSEWKAIALSPSMQLRITVIHPTTIRADYPDVIAGSPRGRFNASAVKVFVRASDTPELIYSYEEAIASVEQTRIIEIFGTSGLTVTLPSPASDFGLYSPENFTLEAVSNSSSTLADKVYEVAIAYVYRNTVTSISHSFSRGCIREMSGDFFEVGSTVAIAESASALRAFPSPTLEEGESTIYIVRAETNIPYYWEPLSIKEDNGNVNSEVLKPDDKPIEEPGRWEQLAPPKTKQSVTNLDELRSLNAPKENGALMIVMSPQPSLWIYDVSNTLIDSGTDNPIAVGPLDNVGRWIPLYKSSSMNGNGYWLDPVRTLSDLRKLNPPADLSSIFVEETKRDYYYDSLDKETDDNINTIKPNLVPSGVNGRFKAKVNDSGGEEPVLPTIAATVSADQKFIILTEPTDGSTIQIRLHKSTAFKALFLAGISVKAIQLNAWESLPGEPTAPTPEEWEAVNWRLQFPPEEGLLISHYARQVSGAIKSPYLTFSTYNPAKPGYAWDRVRVSIGEIANGILPVVLEGF